MTVFTSYAQNFEDVILMRALKHIANGRYIDIGAHDPLVDSVSLAFYERGWRGIHVEPMPDLATKLRAARPEEEVLDCMVGKSATSTEFFEIPGTGLSTASAMVAETHRKDGWEVRSRTVKSIPLSEVLDRAGDADIHWLKIDVEGLEADVIESWQPSKIRPWIVVVESTEPLSMKQSHPTWEATLLSLGYCFVYFDGLNRFYVSDAHPELADTFGPGPNVFDEFAIGGSASAPFSHNFKLEVARLKAEHEATKLQNGLNEAALVNLAEEKAALVCQIADLGEKLLAATTEAAHGRAQIDAILSSTSWRVTMPMRKARTALTVARRDPAMFVPLVMRGVKARIRRVGSMSDQFTSRIGDSISSRQRTAASILAGLNQAVEPARSDGDGKVPSKSEMAQVYPSLSPRARQVLDDITSTISRYR